MCQLLFGYIYAAAAAHIAACELDFCTKLVLIN
jgi:hypothetical protein